MKTIPQSEFWMTLVRVQDRFMGLADRNCGPGVDGAVPCSRAYRTVTNRAQSLGINTTLITRASVYVGVGLPMHC